MFKCANNKILLGKMPYSYKKKLLKISITDCNVVYLQTDNLIITILGVGKIISSRHNLLTKTTELTLLIGYAEN